MSATSFLLLILFIIPCKITCFSVKKYTTIDKDCVYVRDEKCKLLGEIEEGKIALCDRSFVKVHCNTKFFFERCMVCYPERSKFLNSQEYSESFVNVVKPGHIFFSGLVTVNGTRYDGVYEIKLENDDENVVINNKVYSINCLDTKSYEETTLDKLFKDEKDASTRVRKKRRGFRVRTVRVHGGSQNDSSFSYLHLLYFIPFLMGLCLWLCEKCIDDEAPEAGELNSLQATPMPWHDNREQYSRDYRQTTNF